MGQEALRHRARTAARPARSAGRLDNRGLWGPWLWRLVVPTGGRRLGRSSCGAQGAAARQCRRRARVPRVLETIQAMARRYASTRPLASACCAARRAAGQVRLNSCRVGSEFIRSCGSSVRRSRAAGIRRGLLPPGSLGSARGGVCRVRHRLGSSRTALQAPLASARLPRRRQRSSAAAFRQGLDASAKATLW